MSTDAYWAITLGLGLLAAVAATALLQVFLLQVRRVERAAGGVWRAGKDVAGNTATTWMLGETAERLADLTEEASRHDDLLRSTKGGS